MQWVTTTVVLDNLRGSDEAAWKQFVGRFRGPIVRFACELGLGPDEAEDVAQETLMDFLRAYRQGQYDRDKGRLSAWLFGIAHRRVLNAGRKLGRGPRQLPAGRRTEFLANLPDANIVQESWDRSWQEAVLHQCLDQVRTELKPTTIRAFELFAIDQRPAAEVADELGMSRNAVFIAKHRVLKRITELTRQFESVG